MMKKIFIGLLFVFSLLCSACCNSTPTYRTNTFNQKIPGDTSDIHFLIDSLTCTEEEYNYYLNKEVDYDYSNYPGDGALKTTNFASKYTKTFHNINNNDVGADLFFNLDNSVNDHPNTGLGIMLYECILYKTENPFEEVYMSLTSFHFSIIAGVNLLRGSPHFATMKSMPDEVMDRDGFVRFSYLLLYAAKIGIHVSVISQTPGYSNYGLEIDPAEYFESVMDEQCSEEFGLGSHYVKEYLDFSYCKWVSYGGKSASDMFHFKSSYVSNYLDFEGEEHSYGVFFSSSNLDGVNKNGTAGNVSSQTGIILNNHKKIYDVLYNFTDYVSDYCEQDDVYRFRIDYLAEIKRQVSLIEADLEHTIEKQLIYLGTGSDKVFKLYITPFVCLESEWNGLNPICSLIDKLVQSEDHISLVVNNPKFNRNFEMLKVFESKLVNAFTKDRGLFENEKNKISFGITWYDFPYLSDLKAGTKQHLKSTIHEKDMIFGYTDNEIRHLTALMNSSNDHCGAFNYQVNHFLVIDETEETGFDFCTQLSLCLTRGLF